MSEMTISNARAKLAEAVDDARMSQEPVHLTRRGQRVAAIIDTKLLEYLMEAAEDLADLRVAEEAEREMEAGEDAIPWDEVKKELGLL